MAISVFAGGSFQGPPIVRYSQEKLEILAHYRQLARYATAASERAAIAEAYYIVEALDLSFFKELGKKLKTGVKRIVNLFKLPQVVAKLKEILGEISVKSVIEFVKKGAKLAKKIGKTLKDKAWWVIDKKQIPTLTSLVQNTELALRAKGIYQSKVEPWVNIVDGWLRKYLPVLSKIALAALFAYIWFNVEELSWEPSDLLRGFTGGLSLSEMIATLPESSVGFLVSIIMGGIGYTIMPYILIPRLLWMLSKGFIKWHKGRFEAALEPAPA